jgi:hypothetical protein
MRWGGTRTLERWRGRLELGNIVLLEQIGKQVPLPMMMLELEGREELMEETLPDDEERCEDAPESMCKFASGCCFVIVFKVLARSAWFQDVVG